MKKMLYLGSIFIILILTAVIMTGCETKTMDFGKITEEEGFLKITPYNVFVGDEYVYSPMGKETRIGRGGGDKSKKDEVAIAMTIKNLSDETVDFDKVAGFTLEQGDTLYKENWRAYALEKENTVMSEEVQLPAGEEKNFYFLITVDTKTRGPAKATFTFDESIFSTTYELNCDTSKYVMFSEPLKKGKKIKQKNYGAMALKTTSIQKKEVRPSKASASRGYTYYYPSKGYGLVDVQLDLQNLQKKSRQAEGIAVVNVISDTSEDLTYIRFEKADGSNFDEGKKQLKSSEKRRVHYLVQLKKKQCKKPMKLYIFFNNKVYTYKLKK